MRDRVVGIENEYGAIVEKPNGDYENSPLVASISPFPWFLKQQNGIFGVLTASDNRLWFPNGGCLYIDQSHPEYASAECRRVRDVVAYNKAGEILLHKIFSIPGKEDEKIHLFKNNVAENKEGETPRNITFGCHENYLVFGLKQGLGVNFRPIFPFLATRQIFDGAGWWKDPKEDEFIYSQRAPFIVKEISSSTVTSERAILNTRAEDHTKPNSEAHRLHLILGDANMLEFALFLKIGTTSLMLSMLEDKALHLYEVEIISSHAFQNQEGSARVLKHVSSLSDLREKVILLKSSENYSMNDRLISPIELQKLYCEQACRYVQETSFESEESETEAYAVCNAWSKTLDALQNKDENWLVGRIDYATKRFLAEKEIKRAKNLGKRFSVREIRKAVDLMYHKIGNDGLYHQLQKASLVYRVISDEDILRALSHPPRDTRAYIRGNLVKGALEENLPPLKLINWSGASFKSPEVKYDFADPLNPEKEQLKKILKDVSILKR